MDKFVALSEPTRRRIIETISQNGGLCVKDIKEQFQISAPAVSQHLKILRNANLVCVEKRAQQRIYSINKQGIDEVWEWMNTMRNFWTDRLDSLEKILEKENVNLKKGKNNETTKK